MRFSTLVFSGVLAALSVSAQSNATSSALVSGTQSATPAQASQATCLAACPTTDTKCRDACIVDPTGVPNPAIACINACVQGNGTAADNLAYTNCQTNCRISSGLLVTSTAASGTATGSGSAATATGSDSAGTSSGASGAVKTGSPTTATSAGASGASATSSGAAAASSTKAGSADNVRVGVTLAGVAGAFVAVLAL